MDRTTYYVYADGFLLLWSEIQTAECSQGRIHWGQSGFTGQSEEATPADGPVEISENHKDTGKIYTQMAEHLMQHLFCFCTRKTKDSGQEYVIILHNILYD